MLLMVLLSAAGMYCVREPVRDRRHQLPGKTCDTEFQITGVIVRELSPGLPSAKLSHENAMSIAFSNVIDLPSSNIRSKESGPK
mgnify:CR=1 FL=1